MPSLSSKRTVLSTVVNGVVKCARVGVDGVSGSEAELDAKLGFSSQLDALRSTVKWLVAGFAGVAAVMIGGLQLSSIGHLSPSSWRLYVALAAAGTGLLAVGYILREATAVLTCEWLTLASFSDDATAATMESAALESTPPESTPPELVVLEPEVPEPVVLQQAVGPGTWRKEDVEQVREMVEDSRHELFAYAAASLPQLHASLRHADEEIMLATEASAVANARADATRLRRAARDAVEYANYCLAVMAFRRLRKKIARASLVAAVSVAFFAYSANPPVVERPMQVQVHFSGSGAQ